MLLYSSPKKTDLECLIEFEQREACYMILAKAT